MKLKLDPVVYVSGKGAEMIKAFAKIAYKDGKIDERYDILSCPERIAFKLRVSTDGPLEYVIEGPNEVDRTLILSFARKNKITVVDLPNMKIDVSRKFLRVF